MMIATWALCAALLASGGQAKAPSDIQKAIDAPTSRPAVAVGLEGSFHGFAGNGLMLSFNPTGRWSLDGGFGWAPAGLTAGVRGRLSFARGPLRPFIGLGLSHSFGATRELGKLEDPKNGGTFATMDVPGSTYMQVMAGGSYVRRGGLFVLWGLGYQRLLGDSNVRLRSGFITKDQFVEESRLMGSGLMLSLSLGYTI